MPEIYEFNHFNYGGIKLNYIEASKTPESELQLTFFGMKGKFKTLCINIVFSEKETLTLIKHYFNPDSKEATNC